MVWQFQTAIFFDKITKKRVQFRQKVGNKSDTEPELGINDRKCQIHEEIFEDFKIFHEGIFAEKLCQTNQKFGEENDQNETNNGMFRPVPDRSHFSTFFQIPDKLLSHVPVLVSIQDFLRFVIDTRFEDEEPSKAGHVRVRD